MTVSSPARERREHRTEDKQPALPAIWGLFADDAVPQRLLVLAKMMERVTSRQLQAEFGLSVAQWRVLAFICISGPATASFIGDAAEVDQAEISRAVKALVKDEMVTREFEGGNRKALVIAPTAAGLERFQVIRERRQAYFMRVTRKLGAAQKIQLNRSLGLIAEQVVAERDLAG